jgi:tetratricopeptide (TPR) repeat protein
MLEHVPINQTGTGLAFDDGRLDFVGIHYPSRIGTFGLAAMQFATGRIEGRQSLSEAANDIQATQTAIFLPYAVALGPLSLGVTGKSVMYSLGSYRSTGYGADLGAKAALFRGDSVLGRETRLSAGVAVRNAAAPVMRLYQDPISLERTLAVGLGASALVRESYDAAQNRVSYDRIAADLDFVRGDQDTMLSPAGGLEYAYLDRYALRGGFSRLGNITVGFGVGGPDSTFRFDYAADVGALAPQHRFTVSWVFTAPKTKVESGVRFSALRRARLDQERLKDRFVREGRAAAAAGDYELAWADFQKARVLDPEDKTVAALEESSREGSKLAGVKTRLDESRRQRAAGNDAKAAAAALDALAFDPASPEAADFAAQLRNELISSGTIGDFDDARRNLVEECTQAFKAALSDRNTAGMFRALGQVKALEPDAEAVWKPLEAGLADARARFVAEELDGARRAFATRDAVSMARAVRRIRRMDPRQADLAELEAKLKKAARKGMLSFYDVHYVRQLYDTAAADYVLGNYASAAQTLALLLRCDAIHAQANALVDRLRDEGRITQKQEP